MSALTQSIKDHMAKIRIKGCFWKESLDGWYHCYKPKEVKQKLKELNELIASRE